ncbi:MAG TPA: CBASS cGAMP-activated phospholipase [Gaiellaceae bacterium]|jgi:patatin-like phospholipase/acyl hydrolase|nr:CBASS cGAMP-activated phospholipase [Gaiellaceae bacterium]
MPDLVKILSIDGGGIRGIIPATVLAEIEHRTGARIADLFDLITGTSTGGILALGLVKPDANGRPQYAAVDLAELYEREGHRIFERSLWHEIVAMDNLLDEKYPVAGLEAVLEQYFGEARLKDAVAEVLVPSYELETREPWFFARHKARADAAYDFPMHFVARATSAAPTYFEPLELTTTKPPGGLVDGGVFANNPTMCGYVEAKELHPENDEVLVVSLGTGEHTRPIHYAQAKDWGLAMWAKPILNVVFDGVSKTVDHQMKILCRDSDEGDPRYYRIQTELDRGSDDMDNTSPANLAVLKEKADELIRDVSSSLDTLCRELTAGVPAG